MITIVKISHATKAFEPALAPELPDVIRMLTFTVWRNVLSIRLQLRFLNT